MKEDVFAQTALVKKNIAQVLLAIDDTYRAIRIYEEFHEQTEKLSKAKELLDKSVFNLDEIEHLVIVAAIGRIDD